MNIISLLIISLGLTMDTFFISITEGVNIKKNNLKRILNIAIIFSSYQIVMTFIGWKIGDILAEKVSRYGYFFISIILLFIGGKMIFDTWKNQRYNSKKTLKFKPNIMTLGFMTSIDALVIGFSFAFLSAINIIFYLYTNFR